MTHMRYEHGKLVLCPTNAMHADPHPTYHKGTKATTLSEYIWHYCGLGAGRGRARDDPG